MAKKGESSNPSADALAGISKDLFAQTNPLRQQFINRGMSLFGMTPGPTADQQKELDTLRGLRDRPATAAPQPFNMSGPGNAGGGFGQGAGAGAGGGQYGGSGGGVASAGGGVGGNGGDMFGLRAYFADRAAAGQPAAPTGLTQEQSDRLSFLEGLGKQGTSTPLDFTANPIFDPYKTAIEDQYKIAKNNLISTATPGGALTSSLANLEGQRARNLSAVIGDMYNQEKNTALQLATGGSAQGISGLGSAASIQAQTEAANAQRQSAAKQGVGSGVGYAIGAK